MKPLKTIATDKNWTLRQRGEEYLVQVDGRMLMTSRRHGSEDALATIGCLRVPERPKVLVGGLGFGFTLRATLETLPMSAKVVVSELSPAVVQWNRELVGHLADTPLDDHRVTVEVGDIKKLLSKSRGEFDAILLDIDNGPFAVTVDQNQSMYEMSGLASLRLALRPGGRLAIWSAGAQGGFLKKLREVGFEPSVEKPGDGKHLIFIGDAPGKAKAR